MLRAAALIATLVALATAQARTVSLFLLDTDPQTLVASVVSANPSTTEYLVGCPTGVDSTECGYNPPARVKHAGSVYEASITAADLQFTMSWECTVQAEATAVCTSSVGGAGANFPGSGTTTVTGAALIPVTVTSGANQLAPAATTSISILPGSVTANSAPTAAVGMGLAGLAVVAMAI